MTSPRSATGPGLAERVRVLVVNSGSSSLKLRLLGDRDEVVDQADLPAIEDMGEEGLRSALHELGPFDAVGHRVVHGGRSFSQPTRIDERVRHELEGLTPLAPSHQPAALRAIDLVSEAAPHAPAVACFDTAFFARLPAAAATYAVPLRWREELGVRKYGFHGLAHASTSRRAGELLDTRHGPARIVTCHLGAGASLASVVDGHCMDTTMGFTPLDGLVMASRSGSIDPGIVLWLQRHAGIAASAVAEGLERHSGLTGLAGTPDMRAVLDRAAVGDPDANLALDVYLHRLRAGIAAMVAAAEGLDALVFSGGVGEHAPEIRERAASGLQFLDITIDHGRNATASPDAEITGSGRVRVFVLAAREDLEVAHGVRAALEGQWADTPNPIKSYGEGHARQGTERSSMDVLKQRDPLSGHAISDVLDVDPGSRSCAAADQLERKYRAGVVPISRWNAATKALGVAYPTR